MGVWGTGPFDSDGAGGWSDEIMHRISTMPYKVMRARSRADAEYHYQEARAAVAVMVSTQNVFNWGSVQAEYALAALERIRRDTDYMSSWRSPKAAARQIDAEVAAAALLVKNATAREMRSAGRRRRVKRR